MVKELNPLVSVCIPTYNGEKYIEEALKSVISQTYKKIEIIISDDLSVDETLSIIDKYKNITSMPFHIYSHIPNGIGANWNNCIKHSNGKYIKFLFQDDVLFPSCIDELVKQAENANNVGMIYCKRNFIFDEDSLSDVKWIGHFGNLHTKWKDLKVTERIIKGKEYLKDEYLLNRPLNKFGEPSAVLIHNEVFNKIGYFNENLKQMLDLEFWWKISSHFNIGFVDKQLVFFRLHNDQASKINSNNKINESKELTKLCYEKLFWELHPKVMWSLFKKYSILGKLYRKIKKLTIFV